MAPHKTHTESVWCEASDYIFTTLQKLTGPWRPNTISIFSWSPCTWSPSRTMNTTHLLGHFCMVIKVCVKRKFHYRWLVYSVWTFLYILYSIARVCLHTWSVTSKNITFSASWESIYSHWDPQIYLVTGYSSGPSQRSDEWVWPSACRQCVSHSYHTARCHLEARTIPFGERLNFKCPPFPFNANFNRTNCLVIALTSHILK